MTACVVHAVAVNADGFRESVEFDVVTCEDGAAWFTTRSSCSAAGVWVLIQKPG